MNSMSHDVFVELSCHERSCLAICYKVNGEHGMDAIIAMAVLAK